MRVEMTEPGEYAPWVTGATVGGMPTDHLPSDVVKTPFQLVIDARTALDNPRVGGVWFSLTYGQRPNPFDLTDQEREYILASVQYALDLLRAREVEVWDERPDD